MRGDVDWRNIDISVSVLLADASFSTTINLDCISCWMRLGWLSGATDCNSCLMRLDCISFLPRLDGILFTTTINLDCIPFLPELGWISFSTTIISKTKLDESFDCVSCVPRLGRLSYAIIVILDCISLLMRLDCTSYVPRLDCYNHLDALRPPHIKSLYFRHHPPLILIMNMDPG